MSKNVNKIIQRLNAIKERNYKRGDIYYITKSEHTVGSEQEAGRPGIVVSNNLANKHSDNVTVVYLTTKTKTELPTHVIIKSAQKESIALCECVVSVSKERIEEYRGRVTREEMKKINEALKIALDLEEERAEKPQNDVKRR